MDTKESPMSFGMSMSMGPRMIQLVEQRLVITMPQIQWSLLQAFLKGGGGPPLWVEPTFEQEVFEPRLKLERVRIDGWDDMTHVQRLKAVDRANAVFRFAYTRGRGEDAQPKYYFKIPLLRNRNVEIDDIKKRMGKRAYERAKAMLFAVGELERIARAVPYYSLYQTVKRKVCAPYGVKINDVVLVSVDRGGRIPCSILMRALGHTSMLSLKIDQGGRCLDGEMLERFASHGSLAGKHVLFVDSTVDSGRQIATLEGILPRWADQLAFRSWSVIGSNERGQDLNRHSDINWGVDPDTTFEDNPNLMGIDYAPGCLHKVVERPTDASHAIMKCLMSVPDGWIYDAGDPDRQIAEQRTCWVARQNTLRAKHDVGVDKSRKSHSEAVSDHRKLTKLRRAAQTAEDQLAKIVSSTRWKQCMRNHGIPSEVDLSDVSDGKSHATHNVLIVGSGAETDLPTEAARFVADNLGPHCSFFAGTERGNPGSVLQATRCSEKVAIAEVRVYKPENERSSTPRSADGLPVHFAGADKQSMRSHMVSDSDVLLVLGGGMGTLREVLIANALHKPIVLIEGYGPVTRFILGDSSRRRRSNITVRRTLRDAVKTILERSTE